MTTNAYEAKRSSPLLASGVVLHMLPAGAQFDLTAAHPDPAPSSASTPRTRTRCWRPSATCATSPATSPPADKSPTALRRRLARTRTSRATDPGTPQPQDGEPSQ